MQSPKVSVCMPMYNASRYLRECIDSVLAQTFTDFEFLIADDGSEDDSIAIVESYADPRIRLIKREHDYIATLNCLLDEAKGEYIARMDADDIMLPNRLHLQTEYMEGNPDVDILGGGMITFGLGKEVQTECIECISMIEMIDSCALSHPTVMMRRPTIMAHHFFYNPEYCYAEDYELWIRMLKRGCTIHNISEPLIRYRRSNQQISSRYVSRQKKLAQELKQDATKWLIDNTYGILDAPICVRPSKCKLTVVIPFLNEGDELVNTVKSIRKTARENVEIVVVNDCSTDNRNYQEELKPFNVRYYTNQFRLGAALSKERGVKLCPTPYFILLDADMRCLTSDWHNILTSQLDDNPNRLLCCKTVPKLTTENEIPRSQPREEAKAAFLTFIEDDYIPGIRWLEGVNRNIPGLEDAEICAVLGACYASSKEYWNQIGGMYGLLHFGCEEAYLSIKSWLSGGGCHYIPEISFSHLYRNTASYYLSSNAYIYNYLAICHMLMPMSYTCRSLIHARNSNPTAFATAMGYMKEMEPRINIIRDKFAQLKHCNFQRITEMNLCASIVQYNIVSDRNQEFIRSIANQITIGATEKATPGLLNGGACGQLLFYLFLTASYPELELKYSNTMRQLYAIISNATSNHGIGYSMLSGISGIGVGLIMMKQYNLIEDDINDLLETIDHVLSEYCPSRIHNTSFKNGIGGIFCYVVSRLSSKYGTHRLDKSFLDELRSTAENILSTKCDTRTAIYAAQFIKSFSCDDYAFLRLVPMDISSPSRFIPQDRSLWIANDPNILGYATEIAYSKFICQKYEKKQI